MVTICNIGAEVGATVSIFSFSSCMIPYLKATGRGLMVYVAKGIDFWPGLFDSLKIDVDAEYDELVEINPSALEFHINRPFTPDFSTPLSKCADAVKVNKRLENFRAGLIGSCTNSSYTDLTRSEDLVKQASLAGAFNFACQALARLFN